MSQSKFSLALVALLSVALGAVLALLIARPAASVAAPQTSGPAASVAAPQASGLLSQSEMESLAANRVEFVREDGARCTILSNGELDCECCQCQQEAAPCINTTPVVTVSAPVTFTKVVTVQLPCKEVATEDEEAFLIDDPPDRPDGPDDPGDEPDTPDKPDTPDTPDDPDTPDEPDTPDTPDKPDTPDRPADDGDKEGNGNNGVGNGYDPQPKGDPKPNDTGDDMGPGNPDNKGGKKDK